MTCDRVWRNCFLKKLNIPIIWRNLDAESVRPERQDVFWVEVTPSEAHWLKEMVTDEDHRVRIEMAIKDVRPDMRGLLFIIARGGSLVQYYPLLNFNDAGIAWEKITPIVFKDFKELDDLFPPSRKIWPGDL